MLVEKYYWVSYGRRASTFALPRLGGVQWQGGSVQILRADCAVFRRCRPGCCCYRDWRNYRVKKLLDEAAAESNATTCHVKERGCKTPPGFYLLQVRRTTKERELHPEIYWFVPA